MIESCYWKEELARIARGLRRRPQPPRWSERAHGVLERDLMLGFFMLRRLIELQRVSHVTRDDMLSVYAYKRIGRNVTRLNRQDIWKLYDIEKETSERKKLSYIANQFIHAYTSLIARDDSRNWSDVFIVSDFVRDDCIWRVPISEIRRVFRIASDDYPHTIKMVFNEKYRDYDIDTN